jgi:hypothetical protein
MSLRAGVLAFASAAALAPAFVNAASATAELPEFTGTPGKTFTIAVKATTLEYATLTHKIKCKAGTGFGMSYGSGAVEVKETLTGCAVKEGSTCTTPTLEAGHIMLTLTGTMAYLNKTKHEVGIDLQGEAGEPGSGYEGFFVFASIDCINAAHEHMSVHVTGSVVGKLTPVNKSITPPETFKLSFTQSAGKQKLTKLEGGPLDTLSIAFFSEPPPGEEVGLAASDVLTMEEQTELKA